MIRYLLKMVSMTTVNWKISGTGYRLGADVYGLDEGRQNETG